MSSNEKEQGDQFKYLFGPPALLEGEDPQRYEALHEAIIADLAPKTALEWINVQDQVNKLWEEQRYRAYSSAIINGGIAKAVRYFLELICTFEYAEELD